MSAPTRHGFVDWPRGPLHLAIGVFDGVHLGHRTLIARLAHVAHEHNALALVVTFDPLPLRFLMPESAPAELTGIPERAALLRDAGADEIAVLPFDRALADLAPEDFVARLRAAGDVRRIVAGPDFQFGRARSGAIETLRAQGARDGFEVEEVSSVIATGAAASSTRIRAALGEGDLATAHTLLGRDYAVSGTVVEGNRRGTILGYPTANLAVAGQRLLPRDGIYAAWLDIAGGRHAAAVSLGVRPTFGDSLDRRLEAFVLDYSGDLYGKVVTLTFVERLRNELRFESAEALVEQIARDVAEVRRICPNFAHS